MSTAQPDLALHPVSCLFIMSRSCTDQGRILTFENRLPCSSAPDVPTTALSATWSSSCAERMNGDPSRSRIRRNAIWHSANPSFTPKRKRESLNVLPQNPALQRASCRS